MKVKDFLHRYNLKKTIIFNTWGFGFPFDTTEYEVEKLEKLKDGENMDEYNDRFLDVYDKIGERDVIFIDIINDDFYILISKER